jgi:glycosyltransferase involved in cell wall biosynthesis
MVRAVQSVSIVSFRLPHYRRAFYRGLKEYLVQRDIELRLIHGPITDVEYVSQGERLLPWSVLVDHYAFHVRGVDLCWQPYWPYVRGSDLIIVEQLNRLLLNYVLILRRLLTRQKIAFWGHGTDLQRRPTSIRNHWKRLVRNHVDWWFAYTQEVKEELVSGGFGEDRITNVQNAIDTEALLRAKSETAGGQLNALRKKLELGLGPIGLYCGRMYKDKRLEFLLEACFRVREQIPFFELIIVGSGEAQDKVIAAARGCPWIHYIGPKYEDERIPYFLVSDVLLMPGAVGLVALDSFALEVPLITTEFPFHGPEVAYLRNSENGVITENTVKGYVAGICKLLSDPDCLARLKAGCRKSASIYTIQAMVENFGGGICACLAGPHRPCAIQKFNSQ